MPHITEEEEHRQRTATCGTGTHYAIHVTKACGPGGDGQCDGFCYDHNGTECSCHCHNAWDLPSTVEGVKAWHDEYHEEGFVS